MKAQTQYNETFNNVSSQIHEDLRPWSEEWIKAVKELGYKYMYQWVNSDDSWSFFATNEARARQGAVELYMEGNGCSEQIAKEYYHWKVDLIEL